MAEGGIKNFARNNPSSFGDTALRSGVTAFSGGLGAGLRRISAAATDQAVDSSAKRFAERLKNRKRGNAGNSPSGGEAKAKGKGEEGKGNDKKKMAGMAFYLVLSLTIFKDVSDLVADASVILSIITPITGLIVSFVVAVYFYLNKVEISTNKIVAYALSIVLEFIPFLNIIPTSTIVLILTKWMENNKEKVEKISGKVSGAINKFKNRRR